MMLQNILQCWRRCQCQVRIKRPFVWVWKRDWRRGISDFGLWRGVGDDKRFERELMIKELRMGTALTLEKLSSGLWSGERRKACKGVDGDATTLHTVHTRITIVTVIYEWGWTRMK